MSTWKAAAATIAVVALGATGAWAQATADPDTQAPRASPSAPADPSAMPSGDGASSGESGVTSPAGSPSDPTTDENQQPGMSPQNPTDPAAGDSSGARVPTSPEGTGTSAP